MENLSQVEFPFRPSFVVNFEMQNAIEGLWHLRDQTFDGYCFPEEKSLLDSPSKRSFRYVWSLSQTHSDELDGVRRGIRENSPQRTS
jgi:hypothetical protein